LKTRKAFCDQCSQRLVVPVVIPCGHSICKSHIDNQLANASNERKILICEICRDEHLIPKNGFVVNKRLNDLLGIDLNSLEANMVKLDLLEKDAENYINDHFEDIKIKVAVRRDDLISKIVKYSDEILRSIEIDQLNCTKQSKQVNQVTANIEKLKEDLKEVRSQLERLRTNQKSFKNMIKKMETLNNEFDKVINEYKSSLVGNKKYEFQFDEEHYIETIFGRLVDFQVIHKTFFINLNIKHC